MGFFSFLDVPLDFMLGWLLKLTPFWSILIMSFILSLLIVLIYKITTNQTLMKSLKEEIKSLQKQMKELKHDPTKMMEVNKKAMETNMKYMGQSFKPMLFTFLPIIIIFVFFRNGSSVLVVVDRPAEGNLHEPFFLKASQHM